MQTKTGFLAVLLTACWALGSPVSGQDYAPPDPVFPLPLYSNRPDDGGFYTAMEFLFMRQTNPLHDQLIGVRGFFDVDGSISAALGNPTAQPGTFIGSRTQALSVNDLGPSTYTPGFNLAAGWRFRNGVSVEFSWLRLAEVKYNAGAATAPFLYNAGPNLADTYVSSFVWNFPPQFSGPNDKVALGNPGATFGIWNAASDMSISFVQRFSQYEMTGRIPVCETDSCRYYGIVGPRMVAAWERFAWRTISRDINGNAGPQDVAVYSNVASNFMYGFHLGCGNETRLGDTPIGTFSVSCDLQTALFLDFGHLVAKYERADRQISSKRSRKDYNIVPELQANVNLWWYPIEGIQLRVGYDAMAFFNTFASTDPVSFNYFGLDPVYQSTFRFFDGLNAGIAFVF